MYYTFTQFVLTILSKYMTHLELIDTIPLGFSGLVAEKPAPVFTNQISEDALYFGATVDFLNPEVLVRIRSISPQYEWMANDDPTPQDTPVNAVAGVFSQVSPIMPLVQPFFIKAQGRLQMQFTNSTTAPITGGRWTWRALRLTNPINGGWDYSVGYN